MSKVRDNVRLHPTTVSEHQKHIVRKSGHRKVQTDMSSIKVDMRVWRKAMELAKGDSTRIVVKSPVEVVVTNNSKKKN